MKGPPEQLHSFVKECDFYCLKCIFAVAVTIQGLCPLHLTLHFDCVHVLGRHCLFSCII